MKSRIIAVAAATTLTALVLPAPAEAGPPPVDKGRVLIDNSVCSTDDYGFVNIGGSLYVQEFGQHGVQKFKVRWTLKPIVTVGIAPTLRTKTKETGRFPNDARNFKWDDLGWNGRGQPNLNANAQFWTGVSNGYDAYKLLAKITWDRANRLDWNQTVQVAVCSS